MTDTTTLPARPATAGARTRIAVLLAAVAAVLVNAVIAAVAASAVPAGSTQIGLIVAEYAPFTVVGVLAGTVGWSMIRAKARRPYATLRKVVPGVLVASFVPDFLILATGASLLNSFALVLMHLVVAAVTLPTLARVLPVSRDQA
jgi:hypothetical protein